MYSFSPRCPRSCCPHAVHTSIGPPPPQPGLLAAVIHHTCTAGLTDLTRRHGSRKTAAVLRAIGGRVSDGIESEMTDSTYNGKDPESAPYCERRPPKCFPAQFRTALTTRVCSHAVLVSVLIPDRFHCHT